MSHHPITQYISDLNALYKAGNATEHSYRPALKKLLEALTNFTATNEPKRIACGAPDYIVTDRDFAVGYVEAKDIPVNLNDKSLKEQLDRYRHSLDNLIITNYLTFRWYAKSELVEEIIIGKEVNHKIVPLNDSFERFMELIRQFAAYHTEGIKTSAELSKQMAAKARLLEEIIETSLNKDVEGKEETELNNQYEGFKSILIDTISTKDFADLYAQTIAYGMFAARMNYSETDDFTREKAAKSIPQTNPFLRKMFGFIAGVDLDVRISWVVDALADLFNRVDMDKIHKEIGRYADNDPIIHFYETFLTDYDKRLKKQRGVWYTPQPVVRFIVRAVDEILKTDFGIPAGLADSKKVTVGDSKYHKVQILDPATGTGTFLAEVVNQIHKRFENRQGMWNSYVNEHLIPRLNGFEILMASYAMAHLKLEMLLQETNVNIGDQRLKIYLTDSLEPAPDKAAPNIPFAKWLTDEANEAAQIKRDTPIMVILGNPPYSVSSINNGKWIRNLIADYKKDLNETKINLDDDYIKFIRLGQEFVKKNGFGILAFITNNSFIDGITHRQMRKNLLETFDKIYILDLHGNAKKKETSPDGGEDKNVFDIQQGVSINIFVRTRNKTATIYQYDLYGNRQEKYNFLLEKNLQAVKWTKLPIVEPYYFFTPKDFSLKEEYERGFKIDELFKKSVAGIETIRDAITIHFDEESLKQVIDDFIKLNEYEIATKYNTTDARDWKISKAKSDVKANINNPNVWQDILYRPFDVRKTFYTGKQNGFVCNGRYNVIKHLLNENVALIVSRQTNQDFRHCFVTDKITDGNVTASARLFGAGFVFPLYLYHETFGMTKKVTNMKEAIVKEIAANMGVKKVSEIRIFDYIYAVLHSPSYRERYKEFLKIDFPRIPYPENAAQFKRLAGFGEKLRKLHLMENAEPAEDMANFPVSGANEIENSFTEKSNDYRDGKVWINDAQYFDNVPQSAWEFYIGGYQPAKKWLKDRRGRKLSFDDAQHYRRIIAALAATEQIMKKIDAQL
ncbi:MAG: N-6 DNA methylase [Prevotellaceae bacterium]|jgi:predicted helicase|nr:N-6 DNA methylase [Prevotellaceae bacterium]